jgi:hypothetical protein
MVFHYDFTDHVMSIVYSYLKNMLERDAEKKYDFYWKFFLRSIREEGLSTKSIENVTRLFMQVYKNQLKRQKEVDQLKEDINKDLSKIVFKNFLNFSAFLIKKIDPKADDYNSKIGPILVNLILRKKHFENSRYYSEILLILHKKVQELDQTHKESAKQASVIEAFVEKELKRIDENTLEVIQEKEEDQERSKEIENEQTKEKDKENPDEEEKEIKEEEIEESNKILEEKSVSKEGSPIKKEDSPKKNKKPRKKKNKSKKRTKSKTTRRKRRF